MVFKGLAKAIRRESNQAVARWWGVDPQTVSKWRRLLGVERANEGTHRLHSGYTQEPWAVRAWAKAHAKDRDPRRRAKIAAAKRGKPRPPHVGRAVAAARLGKRLREETRRRMSRAHRRRGTLVPGTIVWTPEEDDLVRTLPAEEAARRTRRTLAAVYSRRSRLGVPDGRRRD